MKKISGIILLSLFLVIGLRISFADNADFIFGSQLTGNARKTYESLTTLSKENQTVYVLLEDYLYFESLTDVPTDEELADVSKKINRFTQMAVDAYVMDYPDNFWFNVDESKYEFSYFGKFADGKYQWEIKSITYKAAVDSGLNQSIYIMDYSLKKALEEFKVTGANNYEKVKSIYNGLCKSITYSSQANGSNVYGALVNNKAICSGYAKAFKLLCDKEDIPCILITGTSMDSSGKRNSHMWNAVKMEDGKWYAVDVTWGDGNTILYELMLCGTKTKLASVNNKTFSQTHVPSGDISNTLIYIFKYPTLSETAYDPDNVVETPTPEPTATPEPVENPEPGDVNRDGIINANDALLVLKMAARLEECTDIHMLLGDLNQDGELNAEDALMILKISAKIS